MNHQNRIAIISGATGGMGRVIAKQLAPLYETTVLLGRNLARLNSLKEEFDSSLNTKVIPVEVQISDPKSVTSAMKILHKIDGVPEVLVHAAGGGPVADLFNSSEEQWFDVINSKLMGAIRLTKEISKDMVAAKSGSIIFINGTFALEPDPLFPINSTINCAISGFAKAISHTLGASGVRVNIINPGPVDSPLWEKTCVEIAGITGGSPSAVNEAVASKSPFKRLAKISEIADLVLFLASKQASFLNGTAISIDGGMSKAV